MCVQAEAGTCEDGNLRLQLLEFVRLVAERHSTESIDAGHIDAFAGLLSSMGDAWCVLRW